MSIAHFANPEVEIDAYMVGLNLNVWTWLTVATVAVAAVTVCIVLPQVAPAVIGGAVEVGKAAFAK